MTTAATRTPRRRPVPATFQPPVIIPDPPIQHSRPAKAAKAAPPPAPNTDHPRPSQHNGVAVVSEERVSLGPNSNGKLKISRLYLADGSIAFACWECTTTGATRGDIVSHRNAEHGTMSGKRKPKVVFAEKDPDLLDLVLPVREDGTLPGDNPIYWQLGELLALVPTIKAFSDRMDDLETENSALKEELKKSRVNRTDQHKLSVYEANQAEIGELRARLKQIGNVDDMREELHALRLWKKKITTKLAGVGFLPSEEDQ